MEDGEKIQIAVTAKAEVAGLPVELTIAETNSGTVFCGMLSQAQLGLANLPMIGGSSPLLDKVKFDGFGIEALDRGLQIITKLCLPETELALAFPISFGHESPQLKAAEAGPAGEGMGTSISVQKNIGPVALEQIHLKLQNDTIMLGITAGLRFPAVSFEMMDLGIGYQPGSSKVVFTLSGIGVAINAGPLTAGGSFLREGENSYAGSLLFHMGGFSISAIGAYTHQEYTSFFVFGMYRGRIGGPPCFTVTGLAAGFGYQRGLLLPDLDGLNDFPLLAVASGAGSPGELLQNERTLFPPQKGSSWFAAGILFNSFQMVDAVAILTVSLGEHAEIGLLGKAVLNVPFRETEAPFAHAELVLKASFSEEDSLIYVEAELLPCSYILSKACHLSGGFAFYTWYGGTHAGDFVLSLGGYRQGYRKPSHYPDVKRLALNWEISGGLSAAGEMYFALTPAILMAGGNIKFLYSSSHVEAWLMAQVDITLKWKPYRYDYYLGVQVGAKVHLGFIKCHLELGCNLHIWGPEFTGKATIKLWCISFTISFGAGTELDTKETIDAQEFVQSFLQEKDTASNAADVISSSIQISKGTIREYEEQDEKIWVVCAEELELQYRTGVPANKILFNGKQIDSVNSIHIRPCNRDMTDSTWMLTLRRTDGLELNREILQTSVLQERQPAALWGDEKYQEETVPQNTTVVVHTVRQKDEPIACEPETHEEHGNPVSVIIPGLHEKTYDQSIGYAIFRREAEAAAGRKRLLAGLEERYGMIDLMDLSENAEQLFCECPQLVSLGGKRL